MDLKNEQWTRLKRVIPSPNRKNDGRGRPRRDPREVLNGILWILRTGAPWKDLPPRYQWSTATDITSHPVRRTIENLSP